MIRVSLENAHMTSEYLSFLLPAFESGFERSRNGDPTNLDCFLISMISDIFRNYYCTFFGYCSKHYIFKQTFSEGLLFL